MKRFFTLLIVATLVLSGCGESQIGSELPTGSSETESSVLESSNESVNSNPEYLSESEGVANEIQKDESLSESLSEHMLESFGGMGKPEYAAAVTSWYPFIENFDVYNTPDGYYGVLTLNQEVFDHDIRVLLSMSLSEESMNVIVPPVVNACAALDLDPLDAAVIGDSLVKILDGSTNLDVYYASIYAYGIPVYDYMAEGYGRSVDEMMNVVGRLGGTDPVACLTDYMAYNYKGAYTGPTLDDAKTISLAAMTSFQDVHIEYIEVVDTTGKTIATYDNPLGT